ncbi:HNH endonuclease [Clostridium sp.]|uniref:HNH endonuclease n=1 Tax=Clostridium sp. TaxID=1506 RepID=UPI001A5861C7|nr:HNH endonuclease [Clostridium sp.]MBK5242162.1 HNH endonuclease [Clostridium sp.]
MKTIPLTQGLEAIVDNEDYKRLSKYKWYANKNFNTFYARRGEKSETKKKIAIQMHREILKISKEMKIDHIDGNGLNNTKINLRVVTARQNAQNKHTNKSSKYVGVCWSKTNNKWVSNIKISGKIKYLGYFTDELEAHNAYIKELKEINEIYINQIFPAKEVI